MFRVGQSRCGVRVSLVGVSLVGGKFSEYPDPEPTSLSSVGDDVVPCGAEVHKVHHMHYCAAAGVSGLCGAPVVDLFSGAVQ